MNRYYKVWQETNHIYAKWAKAHSISVSLLLILCAINEPLLMLGLMLILPPLSGGQIMIWWSTVIARILSAILALLLKRHVDSLLFAS